MDHIGRLEHLTSQHDKDEMWISTLDLRTFFWQFMLDEDSRPLTDKFFMYKWSISVDLHAHGFVGQLC
jgi:hypothetical protein